MSGKFMWTNEDEQDVSCPNIANLIVVVHCRKGCHHCRWPPPVPAKRNGRSVAQPYLTNGLCTTAVAQYFTRRKSILRTKATRDRWLARMNVRSPLSETPVNIAGHLPLSQLLTAEQRLLSRRRRHKKERETEREPSRMRRRRGIFMLIGHFTFCSSRSSRSRSR